jgi:signal transduction histidine kinase
VVATGVALAHSVSRPLERLRAVATRLGEGDMGARAATDVGPGELRDLASDMNRTAERLERLVTAHADFVGDVSHQLRTPLTALRLRLENLATGEGVHDDVQAALEEVERASRLIDGLLALARAEAGAEAAPSTEAVDLRAVAHERVLGWEPFADELGVRVTLVPGPAALVVADSNRVGQVLDNLLANALEATSPEGTVQVALRHGRDTIELHVVDDGIGLSDGDRARAFGRFWRAPDRPPGPAELGGSGLGLAIVARLAATDGGSARLDRADSGGVDATVSWPCRPVRRARLASQPHPDRVEPEHGLL